MTSRTGVCTRRYLIVGLLLTVSGITSSATPQNPAAPPSAGNGEALYREHCAGCHEAGVPRAVNRPTLARLSAENIRFALTQGSMRPQAAQLTAPQLDAVVRWIGDAIWQTRLGQGGRVGGVQWGSAADDSHVYVAPV